MEEYKIKLKLPSEVVIHIPSFSEMTLERCMQVATKDGLTFVERTITELIAEEIVKRNMAMIKKFVDKQVPEIEHNIIQQVLIKFNNQKS